MSATPTDRRDFSYRGYRLEVANSSVTVRDCRGRELVTVKTFSAARRFVRGYRSHTVKAEPANYPAKVLAGSDREGA